MLIFSLLGFYFNHSLFSIFCSFGDMPGFATAFFEDLCLASFGLLAHGESKT